MKSISVADRILLLLAVLLAAYQVVLGIDEFDTFPIICYTIAFGVLLVACLLLIILGFEILDSSPVVVISTIIPLSLSLGLVWEYFSLVRYYYLAFTILGLAAVVLSRRNAPGRSAVFVLAVVHGVAGLLIFLLPVLLSLRGVTNLGFMLVGIGGALIGIGGLLLSFLKTGRPILSRNVILSLLPGLLLLTTIAFVVGFALR